MSTLITSPTNPKIKRIRRLLQDGRFRQREQLFVVEGTRWLTEIIAARISPGLWLATAEWLAQYPDLAEGVTALSRPPLLVAERLMSETAETETPSGVLAVLPQPALPWPPAPSLVVVLDGLRDPGNVGTIMRTAAAAGADGLLLGPGTVDRFNPKVVRSSMGALLRLPTRVFKWSAMGDFIVNCQIAGADAGGEVTYTEGDWTIPTALIIGNEAHGLGREARQAADLIVSIPMAQPAESLNAAVASGIILFEAARQKRVKLKGKSVES